MTESRHPNLLYQVDELLNHLHRFFLVPNKKASVYIECLIIFELSIECCLEKVPCTHFNIFKDISPVTFGTSSDQTSPEQPTKTLYDWLEIDSYLYKLNLIVVHQRSQLVGKVLHVLPHCIIPTWSKHA